MDINDRVKEIIRFYDSKPSSFARSIGVAPTTIINIVNGNRSPGKEVLTKILQRYPDISESWLLFEEGSILKANETITLSNESSDLYNYNSLVRRVEEITEEIKGLRAEIAAWKAREEKE